MFPANMIAQAQNKLPVYHVPNVPLISDQEAWDAFLAEADEAREVIFAMHHPNGFKQIHELLPTCEWIFMRMPKIEMLAFVGSYLQTIQYPRLSGYWVVD